MSVLSKLTFTVLIISSAMFADNIPSVHQVYETAKSGNLEGAHRMIEAVLKAHPESAKAHYVDAEILAREGDLAQAKDELLTAKRLQPNLAFAKPQSVHALEERISPKTMPTLTSTQSTPEKPFPWLMLVLGIGAILLIIMAIRSFNSRNTANMYQPISNPNFGNGNYQYPNTPAYGQPSGGIGSSVASGLVGGAAAGVGFVAAEELMHHFMDSPNNSYYPTDNVSNYTNNSIADDMGGSDFGIQDSSSWDDGLDSGSNDNW